MNSTGRILAGAAPRGRATQRGLAGPALGLRLLALAAVAGSGALHPDVASHRVALVGGILAGAALGALQFLAATRGARVRGELFVLAQLAVWTYLLQVTGGQGSPVIIGYLLEIPLSAVQLGGRGARWAAVGAGAAYLASSLVLDPPLDGPRAALAAGFIAVTALLTTILTEVVERQRRQIEASQAALRARAENLAEELRMLGDYLIGGLVGLDDLGRVMSLNPAGAEILGVDRATALGRPWPEVLPLDAPGREAVVKTLADGSAQRGLRFVLEHADGRRAAVAAELWVSPSAAGRRTWLLMSPAAAEAGGSDPLRRLGEAVACVSHQIKNSLHALQGFAREIDREIGESRSDTTRDLLRALQSLGELAEDVLAMSGAPRPSGERVPLGDALATAVKLTRVAGVRIEVTPGPELHVRAHRGQLIHALFNLLDNACRASPPGLAVRVRTAAEQGRAVLEIRDRGPGLPDELAHLDGRAPSRNGSGLGLLAARRFIEANQGELAFERLPEGGTSSRIALPLESHPTVVCGGVA